MESMTFCEESVIGGAAKLLLAIVCGASLIYPFAIESTFSCGSSRGFGTTCRASCDVPKEMLDRFSKVVAPNFGRCQPTVCYGSLSKDPRV